MEIQRECLSHCALLDGAALKSCPTESRFLGLSWCGDGAGNKQNLEEGLTWKENRFGFRTKKFIWLVNFNHVIRKLEMIDWSFG